MNRAKYTAFQVLGIVLVCAGLSGLAYQAIPRPDSIPSVPLSELGLASDHSEKAAIVAADMPKFQIVGADGQDNTRKDVRLWKAMLDVRGSHHPNVAQQIGDCVSWGAANAVNYLQAVQIIRGPPGQFEWKPAYPPYIYGVSRVQVGRKHGSNFRGDGSIGAYAAEGVRDYGVLRADATKCPPYSGSIAKEWGAKGAPDWAIAEAKQFSVKTIAQVTSAEEARDAICNGYPVTIASGWWGTNRITNVDGRMVATRNTSWAHQQCLIGYDGSGREPYFYCLNSWGPNAHPQPLQGEPPGGYWIRFNDVDRICGEKDSWAMSSFDGFPAEAIDWDQLLRRTVSSNVGGGQPQAIEGGIMLTSAWAIGLSILAIMLGLLLFRWAGIGRNRLVAGLACMLCGVGIANAQQPDFGVAASRETEAIDWIAACERSESSESPSVTATPSERITGDAWEECALRSRVVIKTKVIETRKSRSAQAILFTAAWCAPCQPVKDHVVKKIVPQGWTASEDENADFRIVDTDKRPDIQRQYAVTTIPTVVYLGRDGREFKRLVGRDTIMAQPMTAALIQAK
jgi:thiol-disulfide isomerase/thioredoxin